MVSLGCSLRITYNAVKSATLTCETPVKDFAYEALARVVTLRVCTLV